MFCPFCGAENRGGKKFCRGCGQALPPPRSSSVITDLSQEQLQPSSQATSGQNWSEGKQSSFEKPTNGHSPSAQVSESGWKPEFAAVTNGVKFSDLELDFVLRHSTNSENGLMIEASGGESREVKEPGAEEPKTPEKASTDSQKFADSGKFADTGQNFLPETVDFQPPKVESFEELPPTLPTRPKDRVEVSEELPPTQPSRSARNEILHKTPDEQSELSHDQGDSNRLYKTGATAALPAGLADAWASQSEKTEDAEEGAVNSSSAFYKASSVSRLVDPEMEETIDEVKADPSLLEADTVSAPALFAGNLDDFGSVMEKTEEVPVLTEVFETEERTEEVPILRMAREKQEELERAVKAEDKVPVVTSAIGNTSAAEKNVLARANPMPAVASVPVQSFAPVETPKSFTGALQGLQVERASQIERVVLIVSVVTAVLGLVILIWFWLIRPNTVSFNFRAESSIRENYKKLI